MLPASRRLRLTRDFERIFSTGKTLNGSLCRLKSLANRQSASRFAVVVSAKVSKRAVVRNRVRRRFWAAISACELLSPSGLDIVFICSPEAASADYQVIKQEVTYLLTKRLHRS